MLVYNMDMPDKPEGVKNSFEQTLETNIRAAENITEVLAALKVFFDAGGTMTAG
jgi:hypothetical protein